MMLPIALMLYVLEWLSLMIKCFVLAMRLFGTMMAGHLVLAAFVGLIFAARAAGDSVAYGVSVPVVLVGTCLTLLELFVCCLQAFIFTFLTVLFISQLAVHEHDEHLDDDPHAMTDADQMDPDKIFRSGSTEPCGPRQPSGGRVIGRSSCLAIACVSRSPLASVEQPKALAAFCRFGSKNAV